MLRPGSYFRHEQTAVSISNNPMLLTALLCIAWTIFGLIGHDPWKSEEAVLVSHLVNFTNSDFCLDLLAINGLPLAGPLFYATALSFMEAWALFSHLMTLLDSPYLSGFCLRSCLLASQAVSYGDELNPG